MGVFALVVKRARAGLGLLLTILVLAAGTTAIIAGTLGYSEAAATTAARHALSDAEPTEAGIRVQTRLADDPAAQASAGETIIREAFAPTEVLIQRTIVSEPRSVTGQSGRLVVMTGPALTTGDPTFGERVEVTEGSWPTSGGEVVEGALHASVASTWEVGVGDQLDVSGTPVEITALWRPVDAQEAFWFGDPLAETGVDGGNVGPLVVPEDSVGSFGSTPFVRFTVQPDPDEILPADMPRLAAVAGTLDREMRTPEVEVRGVTVEGDLAPTAAAASRNLATARALNLVPVTLLLLVSLIAIVQIARLQAEARAGEVELLIARGAARRQVLLWSLVESLAVAVVAAALGIVAALGVMRLVPAGALQTGIVVRTGILAGVAVIVALVVVNVLQVRTLAARTATDRSGRTRTVAALGTIVLTLGAAALSWWQLRRYGSPLVTSADGSLRTDLVAGAAPALLLAAAALLATTILGPVARFVETLSRRSRGLLTHLVSAQVSRRIVVYAVPVVLTVLAVGATTVSGLYAGTSAQLRNSIAELGRGADLRAVTTSEPVSQTSLATVPTLAGVEGVDASAPIWLSEGRVGSNVVSYTTLPVDQLGGAVSVPEGVLDVAEVTQALRGDARPTTTLAVPDTATALDLSLDITAAPQDADALQEQATHDYEWMGDQFAQEYRDQTGEDPDPAFIDEMARDQVEIGLRGFLRDSEVTTVLWFWDEGSQSLLRVEAPPVGFTFGVSLSDPPGSPEVTVAPETTSGTVQVPVDPGPGRSLVGIDLGFPQTGHFYDLDVAVTSLTTTGEGDSDTNLLADPALADWQTTIPSEWPEPDEDLADQLPTPTTGTLQGGPEGLTLTATSGREDLNTFRNDTRALVPLRDPGLIDPGTAGAPGGAAPGTGEEGTGAGGEAGDAATADPGPDESETAVADPSALPVALTATLAETGNFQVGSPLSVQVFGGTIQARVGAIVTAVPGSTSPHSILIDSTAVSEHLSTSGDTLGRPTQLWASSSDPGATLERVQELPDVAAVSGPDAVSVTDAASAVRLVFWVASAGAVLLAVTGIGAVAANLLRVRRPEVLVLRALGMTPGGQARARTAELFAVVLASVGLGLVAGWLVSRLVVPELSRSTTLAGQAQLPAPLALEVPLWAALLGALLLVLVLLLAVLYTTVRNQALDREYREEIR
ncbi:hypothetical protein MWU75_08290 [Ornithinimicrobium sp. F0845]|uniref:FtsX-like permease family protein n=1 Tax=Ornithinimicrobium sp. F0845 TaxID=2926412 RepID=UPI001FF26216|nr:FtsX-like permease family protein [Ornithinimicrobium sp. F0845]MCK0112133.1 hypothetical protein [Ornithinimicrobium sp. F0845]